jgi:hypothetical protein
MVGWDGSLAEGIQRINEAREQFFQQACDNGASANEWRARAEAAERVVERVRALPEMWESSITEAVNRVGDARFTERAVRGCAQLLREELSQGDAGEGEK